MDIQEKAFTVGSIQIKLDEDKKEAKKMKNKKGIR